jgi:putative transcriptional regulator
MLGHYILFTLFFYKAGFVDLMVNGIIEVTNMIRCNLKYILKERGIKHGYVADKAGLSKAAFSSLINNKSLPTLEVAYRIGDVLALRVEEIWIREEHS